MKPALLSLCISGMLLSACADMGADYTPIIDGAPSAGFDADLAACQTLARDQKQLDQETMAAMTLGAGAGAVLGALDDDDELGTAIGGAIAGALVGGAMSAAENAERREGIVVDCMRGRGHRVVG